MLAGLLLGAVVISQLCGPLSQLNVGSPVAQRECRTVEGPRGANELRCCSRLTVYRFNAQKSDCDGTRFIFGSLLFNKKKKKQKTLEHNKTYRCITKGYSDLGNLVGEV